MILDDLKDQTRPLHDSLDGSPRLRALFSPDLTLAGYVALLEDFRAVYEPLERGLGEFFAAHDIAGLDFQERRKLALLDRDLTALKGRKSVSADISWTFVSPASALGCLYVLEGATLGGQVIARTIGRRFGMNHEYGLAFFTSYQEAVLDKWRSFRNVVGNMRLDEAQEVEMIDAAKKTFAIFIARLRNEHVMKRDELSPSSLRSTQH